MDSLLSIREVLSHSDLLGSTYPEHMVVNAKIGTQFLDEDATAPSYGIRNSRKRRGSGSGRK